MSNSMPQTPLEISKEAPCQFMDREGKVWPIRNLKPFFLPDFYEATRCADGVRIVVHRSDFQRTQKG